MDIPRRAAEIIASLDAQLGQVMMVPVPEGSTPVNVLVIVKTVAPDGDVDLRFGHTANMSWLDVSALLLETPRMMDRTVYAMILKRELRGGGDDVDGFLRGLGLNP